MARKNYRNRKGNQANLSEIVNNHDDVAKMNSLEAAKGWRILTDDYYDLQDAIDNLGAALAEHTTKGNDINKAFEIFKTKILMASERYWVANGLSKKDYRNVINYLRSMTDVLGNDNSWQELNTLTSLGTFNTPRQMANETLFKTSKLKKALGIALIVLGVALLISTAIFCVVSWGTLVPVAPLIGLAAQSAITAGITALGLSTALSCTMATAGVGLGLFSLFKAKHCFKAGATKDIAVAGEEFMQVLDSKKPSDFTFTPRLDA